jgi:hypothetical protein
MPLSIDSSGVVALTERHLLRVLEEVLHRDAETARDFRDVGLDGGRALGTSHGFANDLLGA